MTQVKYLIIGAGISGLTAANYLKKDYLLIEKENEPGGYCRTIHRGDYVWDYAGHFFHFKTVKPLSTAPKRPPGPASCTSRSVYSRAARMSPCRGS